MMQGKNKRCVRPLSRVIMLSLGLFFFQLSKAQTVPPPMSMPGSENQSLVDTIIKITQYQTYFYKQCIGAIDGVAERKKWTPEKISSIKASIRFEYFNATIYNLFGSYKTSDLLALIKKYKANPFCVRNNAIPVSWMVQTNLNSFLDALVEGKYVMP